MAINMQKDGLDDLFVLGRYTLFLAVLFEMILINQTANLIFMVFGGASPKLIGCLNQTWNSTSTTEKELCSLFESGNCEPIIESQFYSAWSLLCSFRMDVKQSTSFQMIAMLLGAVVFGQVSDAFGRKYTLLICVFSTSLCGFVSILSQTFFMFTITRSLASFFNGGHVVVLLVFMCETIPKKHRLWISFMISWAPNYALFAVLAYFTQDWRWLTVVVSACGFVACALLLFAQESCFWLLRHQKFDDLKVALEKIYSFDGRGLDQKLLNRTEDIVKEAKLIQSKSRSERIACYHLFCTWQLIAFVVTICYDYFAANLVSYAIMFNMEDISGSIYFNTFLMGSVRTIMCILTGLIDYKWKLFGRRISHNVFAGYTILVLLVTCVLEATGTMDSKSPFLRYFILSGASAVSQLFSLLCVTTSELFPTHIRNMALSMMELWGSFACAIAPQLFAVTLISPYLIMLVSMVIGIVMYCIFIPETKGHPLPDEMPPIEKRLFGKRKLVSNGAVSPL